MGFSDHEKYMSFEELMEMTREYGTQSSGNDVCDRSCRKLRGESGMGKRAAGKISEYVYRCCGPAGGAGKSSVQCEESFL